MYSGGFPSNLMLLIEDSIFNTNYHLYLHRTIFYSKVIQLSATLSRDYLGLFLAVAFNLPGKIMFQKEITTITSL